MENRDPGSLYILAAIPAFNEEETLYLVVRGARRYVHDVIVVDDGSTDRTAVIAATAGATVIGHERNLGKAAALMTAFRAAAVRKADVLVLLDGDGQHRPDDIPHLVQPIVDGDADVVVGSRFLDLHSRTPAYRKIGQVLLNLLTHLGSRQPCSDSQSGFRAFNRTAFTSIRLSHTSHQGMAAESEMQFEISDRGLRLREVPIEVSYHRRARRNPIRHGMAVLSCIVTLTFQRRKRSAVGVPVGAAGAAVVALTLINQLLI